jgi:hypothetical protein
VPPSKRSTPTISSIVSFTSAPTTRSRSSLSHTHKFMVFFRNRITVLTSSVSLTTCIFVNRIVSFTLTTTPHSRNQITGLTVFVNPTTCRVANIIVEFTPAPTTPRSRSSLSHTHKFMGFFRNRITVLTVPTCSSPPSNPVYTRSVDLSFLVFSLSSHRHSCIGLLLISHLIPS